MLAMNYAGRPALASFQLPMFLSPLYSMVQHVIRSQLVETGAAQAVAVAGIKA